MQDHKHVLWQTPLYKTTAGSDKLDGTGTLKRFLRLHEGKETEKWVRNQFLSDPFERIGYEWNG